MDWQSPTAAAIAILCALWLAWQVTQPFASGRPTACGGCTFCGVDGKIERPQEGLLQLG